MFLVKLLMLPAIKTRSPTISKVIVTAVAEETVKDGCRMTLFQAVAKWDGRLRKNCLMKRNTFLSVSSENDHYKSFSLYHSFIFADVKSTWKFLLLRQSKEENLFTTMFDLTTASLIRSLCRRSCLAFFFIKKNPSMTLFMDGIWWRMPISFQFPRIVPAFYNACGR